MIKIPKAITPKANTWWRLIRLDGSSNIDVNLAVGTIFSILRCREGVDADLQDFLAQRC